MGISLVCMNPYLTALDFIRNADVYGLMMLTNDVSIRELREYGRTYRSP